MDKMYRLCEVEELIADMDFSDVDDDIAETDEEYQLIISGLAHRLSIGIY